MSPRKSRAAKVRPTPSEPAPASVDPRVRTWPWMLGIFVALGGLFVASLCPSVAGGDSGELMSASLTGGVPHPPGYPLFALLARLFNALPVGTSPAYRVNLLSAVTIAAAGTLLAHLVLRMTGRLWASLVAAAFFGTNSLIWQHATTTEVFGLHLFFVALALQAWLSVEQTRDRRSVYRLALVCGLAMSNHHTFFFVGAPLVLRSLWIARGSLGFRGGFIVLGLGVLGLLPYGYLAWASQSNAAISWGDQTTWQGFWDHILRRNYGTFSLGQATAGSAFVHSGTFFPTLYRMWGHAFPRFLWAGGALALYGFWHAFKTRDRSKIYLLAVFLFYSLTFAFLSNLDTRKALYQYVLSRFFMQSDLLFAVFVGCGVARLGERLASRIRGLGRRPWILYALGPLVFLLGIAVHGRVASQRNNTIFPDFVKTAFQSLPPHTILITMGDHLTGSVFYFREVEKLRPDVVHLDRELLGFPWYAERKRRLHPDVHLPDGVYGKNGWGIKKLLDGNPNRPLVVIDRLEPWDQTWKDGYKLATNGLVHPLVPSQQFPTFQEWKKRDQAALGTYDVLAPLRHPEGSWEHALGQMVMATQGGRAHLALVYSSERNNDPVAARLSVRLLEQIVAGAGGDAELSIPAAPGMRKLYIGPSAFKDLGIGYEILSKVDPAYLPRVAIAFEKFVAKAAPDDPDLGTARRYVEQHRKRTR